MSAVIASTLRDSAEIKQMAYRIIIGNRTHVSDDYSTDFETSDGQSPWAIVPSEGGGIPENKMSSLPCRLIVKSGFNNTELSTFGSSYFVATDRVKAALESLDPRFEFYPLEVVDLVQRKATKKWLLHSPHRVQVINLEATGEALIVEQNSPKIISGKLVEFPKFYRVRNDSELVLDKRAIEGLHLWSGIGTSLSGHWFCSETFKRATELFARSFDFEFTREA